MTNEHPHVSVIVPTRDRGTSLALTLDALSAQTYDDFEVVVIDDGSSDDTPAVIAAAGPRVRGVRTEGIGAVMARCAGIKQSRGDVLAFTDSDCVPQPDWLAHGVVAIDAGADIAQGRTIPERTVGPLERSISHSVDDGLFATCNMFYRRDAYERAGGFDRVAFSRLGFRPDEQAKGLGFGEDTLLGWAVARRGVLSSVPEAVVRHEVVQPPLREMFSRAWMAGAFPALVREVPELKGRLIRHRVVLGRTDPRLGAYGLFLSYGPLAPIGLLAIGWWIGARAKRAVRRPGRVGRRAYEVAIELALDLTTAVALLVGSVRARTPVI